MKKIKGAIIILFLLLLMVMLHCLYFPKIPPPQATQVEVIAKSMESVVAVYHPTINIPASGFYIGNGIIVTAGHVADVNGLEKVVFENGSEYSILEQIVHPDYDCGFLILNDPDEPVLKFDTAETQRGEEVYILGNPGGEIFVLTKGVISGRTDGDEYFGDALFILSDITCHNGSSGSVLLDTDGEIRGVHIGWIIMEDYGVNVCVADILKALEQAGLEID